MTKDELIALAMEAGFKRDNCGIYQPYRQNPEADCLPQLKQFAELIRVDEREKCAKVCEQGEWRLSKTGKGIAAAIRARQD